MPFWLRERIRNWLTELLKHAAHAAMVCLSRPLLKYAPLGIWITSMHNMKPPSWFSLLSPWVGTKHACVKLAIVTFSCFFQVVEWHITQLRIGQIATIILMPAGLQTRCLASYLKALWRDPWQGRNSICKVAICKILTLSSSCSMAYNTQLGIPIWHKARLQLSFWCQRDFKRDLWRVRWKPSDECRGRDKTYLC